MRYYSITVTEYFNHAFQQSTIYGIEYNNGDSTVIVNDITTDYERLKRLVDLCNELGLEVSQLNDIVEDFLSE